MKLSAKKICDSCDFFWFGPQPLWQLGVYRILTGLIMLYYMTDKLAEYQELLTPVGYHIPRIENFYMQPVYLAPVSIGQAQALVIAFLASCVCFTIGYLTRLTTPLLLILFFYITMLDPLSAFTINKVFLCSLFFLSFSRCGDSYSVDSWVKSKNGTTQPREFCSGWVHRVLQLTLVSSYLVAGLCKALPSKGHWLIHPDVLFTQMGGTFQTGFAFWLMKELPPITWEIMQYGALGFELFAVVLFLTPRLRLWAILSGLSFHLLIAATMHMLLPFSLQFISLYVFFWDKKES